MSKYNDRIKFEQAVLKEIQGHSMISPSQKVLVALSGGADSVCLFRVLLALREQLDISIAAVHVNHQLRDTANRDEIFVSKLCKTENVCLYKKEVDVIGYAKKEGLGLEEAARILRYEVFGQAKEQLEADCIALAHHMDDQAETVLFHMCRGCGVEGLRGIQPVRENYIRPLLGISRKEIESYLTWLEQEYMIDETNADTTYKRNMLRTEILPLMSEHICKQTIGHISQMAEDMANLESFLDQQLTKAYERCVRCENDKYLMHIPSLQALHPYLQSKLIKKCLCDISKTNKDIARIHVMDVLSLVQKQSGREIHLPYHMKATRSYDILYLERQRERKSDGGKNRQKAEDCSINETPSFYEEITLLTGKEEGLFEKQVALWDGRRMIIRIFERPLDRNIPIKPYTKWVDYAKIDKSVVVRTPRQGDYLFFDDKHKKLLKDHMKNEKIPAKERKQMPIVACGDHVMYVIGGRISNAYKVTENTRMILEFDVLQYTD